MTTFFKTSNVTLQATIMTHPSRLAEAAALKEKLHADVGMSVDQEMLGAWPNFRSICLSTSRYATHHLILQDDILPSADLLSTVLRVAYQNRAQIISLFGRRRVIERACERGDSWCVMNGLSWGQALCLPRLLIKPFVIWCDQNVRPEYKHDDARLSLYALHHDLDIWYTVPCLVEHLELPSIQGNPVRIGGKPRTAKVFLGDGMSGMLIDWKRGYERPLRDGTYRLADYKNWRLE